MANSFCFKQLPHRCFHALRRDPVLCVAALLALLSTFFVPPSAAYIGYFDFRTLSLLFSLMLAVSGLRSCGVFDWLVAQLLALVHTTRTLSAVLILLCFFSSMLMTNDVALITFVPLAILLLEQTKQQTLLIPVIVLQTIAANLGSMLTPLGNPQNLYLYSLSGMGMGQFLGIMLPPTVLSLAGLVLAVLCIKPLPLQQQASHAHQTPQRRSVLLWCSVFLICLLTVLHLLPFWVTLVLVVLVAVFYDRKLLLQADYGLLLTFIFFFVFIGNMKNISFIYDTLSTLVSDREMMLGILMSQIISNVPAAMLLSGFSTAYKPLLIGVNLGGLGTLIASMASMISYKQYSKIDCAKPGQYLLVFTALNLSFLAALWLFEALL